LLKLHLARTRVTCCLITEQIFEQDNKIECFLTCNAAVERTAVVVAGVDRTGAAFLVHTLLSALVVQIAGTGLFPLNCATPSATEKPHYFGQSVYMRQPKNIHR
jgi:hypothetical protein